MANKKAAKVKTWKGKGWAREEHGKIVRSRWGNPLVWHDRKNSVYGGSTGRWVRVSVTIRPIAARRG